MKIFSFILLSPLLLLFLISLKIGFLFFGGGYAVISVIHRELVSNLHLLTERQFIDGMAISQLTPGPVAIFATFAGFIISGVSGAIVASFGMFLPGSALMFYLSKKYELIKNSAFAHKVLNAVIPVVVGLLIATALQLGKTTIINWFGMVEFLIAFILLVYSKISPAILILIAAFLGLAMHL